MSLSSNWENILCQPQELKAALWRSLLTDCCVRVSAARRISKSMPSQEKLSSTVERALDLMWKAVFTTHPLILGSFAHLVAQTFAESYSFILWSKTSVTPTYYWSIILSLSFLFPKFSKVISTMERGNLKSRNLHLHFQLADWALRVI